MLDDSPRYKLMADRLQVELDAGRIENDFVESFIPRIRQKIRDGRELSEKEAAKLEELFDQY